nr:uncharacterized protein LOC109760198 isoform X2 [Aegilops tauschii subsp. strangulata]
MRRDLQIEETTQNGSSLPQPYRCSPSSHAQVRRGRKQGLGATPARRQSDAQPSLLKIVSFIVWTEMESVEAANGNSGRVGIIVWTNAMTKTMLDFLAGLVADVKRTSSGFRDVHHR